MKWPLFLVPMCTRFRYTCAGNIRSNMELVFRTLPKFTYFSMRELIYGELVKEKQPTRE